MNSRTEPAVRHLRIITQYFVGGTRVCELEVDGILLDLHISKPRVDVDASPSGWAVQARSDHSNTAVVVRGMGVNGAEALAAAGAAWNATTGLHRFDWEDVAKVLRTVSAI